MKGTEDECYLGVGDGSDGKRVVEKFVDRWRGEIRRSALRRDLKVDMLARSIAEALDLRCWYGNSYLDELGVRDWRDGGIAGDGV